MQRANISLVCLLSLSLAGSALAQTAVDPVSEDSGAVSLQDYSGGATLRGTYFDIRHSMGDGVGYRNGYSQIGGFTPFWLSDDMFIASNSRLLISDNNNVGVNTGLVGRRYVESRDRIYGLYGYFDSDETQFGNRYQQFAFGFETLGRGWDFRANGYVPFGTEDRLLNSICVTGNPFFVGNQLAFLGQELREEALSGGDFEFGMPLTPATPWLRGFAGLYAYQSQSIDPVGFRGRIEAWVSDDLSLAVNVTEDRQFGTNVNAVVDFRFSGFKPTRYFPQWETRERMLMPVQRNWRVATDTYVNDVNVAAINPADGQPYFIAHVDNSAAPGGNGSFERPFNTLPAAVPGADIILVARGTTTEGAPLVGSIALEDNQRLLGEGCLHTAQLFAALGDCTVSGTFVLPGSTDSGNFPFLSSGGDIITLANNNEVAGFNLINAGGDAITNTAAGSNNFLLRCLEITGNNGRGINLTNATGFGIIREVNLASGSTNHPNPLGFGNNLGGGVFIDSGAAGLNLAMTNVAMNSDPPGTQAFGVSLLADDGSITTTMTTVQANGNVTGIRLEEADQTLTATLNDVSASGNSGVGVQVVGTGGTILLTSSSLTANNNGLDNLQIGTQAAPLVGTTFGGNFSTSFFNDSVGGSGIVLSQSGGSGVLNLTNIEANDNGVDGLGLFGSAATVMNVNVVDSLLTANARDAFHVEGTTGATINLFVDPTDASGSGRDGLFFNLTGNSTFNATFLNVSLDNSGRSAVHGELDFSTARLVLENTTGANSGEHGLFLSALNNSIASIQVFDGTFAGSGQSADNTFDAIHIESNASNINLGLTTTPGNNVNSTQRDGIFLDIANFSQFDGIVSDGNFTNNLTNAVHANITSGSVANLSMIATPSNNSGADGFFANVDSATFVVNMTDSDFNNSGFLSAGNGLELSVVNNGLFTSYFDNSSFNSNGFDGMHAVVTGAGSVASINLTNGSLVTNNGQDGLGFIVDDGRFNVIAVGSSFSNNGASGTNGSGIIGLINNTGFVLLDLTDTPVTNNLDNGLFVSAMNGSDIRAIFNNSPLDDNGVTTNGDGVHLDLSGSPDSLLVLTNGSTVNRNGGDGIELNATNGTAFSGFFGNLSISDNGQTAGTGNGVIANVNASTVDLTFNTVSIINNVPNATQQIGFQFNVQNAGVLTAGFTASDLSDNILDAIDGTVDGVGSTATVGLDSTVADNSGLIGAVLGVTGGGTLNFSGVNGSSISNSGSTGVFVAVDGAGSVANFDFDTMAINNNGALFGGEGFNGSTTNGAHLNACILNTSIGGNANQGLELLVTDVGSVASFHVESSNVGGDIVNALLGNGSEGLLADVSNYGTLLYRSVNTTYNDNGVNGGLAGVSVTAIGDAANPDSATALLLFSGDTADNNAGDGFFFNAQDGATFTAELNAVAATNNGTSGAGFGINFNAGGADTKAALLMGPGGDLSGNASGPININVVTPIDQIVLSLNGSFNNSPGDGIHIDIDGANTAVVALQGPGSIDNSFGHGIFVRLANVNTGSLLVNGFDSINNSGQDGIHVEFDTVTQGAIEINNIAAINGSGDDAIDVSVINSALVNGLTVPGATIPHLTLVDNDPTNVCLPLRVDVPLDATGLVPQTAFVVNAVAAAGSTTRGINVLVDGSTIETAIASNNVVADSQNGDGIHFDMTNSNVTDLFVVGNQIGGATENGINFDLDNTPITNLVISNNLIGATAGGGGVPIDDSLPVIRPGFNLNSLAGNDDGSTGLVPLGFAANFFGTTYTDLFVNNNGNVTFNAALGTFTPFNLLTTATPIIAPFFADVDTRLGNVVTYGTGTVGGRPAFGVNWIDVRHFSVNGTNQGLPDNTFQLVIVDRSDVAPGDFDFEFNYNEVVWEAGEASGSDQFGLGGSSARAGYSNGVDTAFELPGSAINGAFLDSGPAATSLIQNSLNSVNDGRYIFFARGGGIGATLPNGNDGIRLNATNGSNIENVTITGNDVHDNNQDGIEILLNNSNVTNPIRVASNNIHENGRDGLRVVDPITTNDIQLILVQNTFDQNAVNGVNLSTVAGGQDLRVSTDTNTITANGSAGMNITLADNADYYGGFNANIITGNGAQGVNFAGGVNSAINSDFTGNTINGNAAEGVNIALQTGGQFVGANFYGNTIGTAAARNGSLGVRLTVPDAASFTWNVGDSAQGANNITGNNDAGIGITMTGSGSGTMNVLNSTFSNTINGADPNFAGEGLSIIMADTASLANLTIGDAATANTTFEDNASHGISLLVGTSASLTNPTVQNIVSQNNTGDGLNVTREAFGVIDNFLITDSTFENNSDGIDIIARFSPQVDEYSIINNQIINNNVRGINFDAEADSEIRTILTDNTITGNQSDGVRIQTVLVSPGDAAIVTSGLGTWTGNDFSNNGAGVGAAGAGLEISGVHSLDIGTLASGNLFQNNFGDGIELNAAPGTLNIVNATITGNNREGSGDGLAGIDINSTGGNTITVSNSVISNNFGDGLEIDNAAFFTSVTLTDNLIQFNQRDGVEYMDRGTGFNSLTIDGATTEITDNFFRGVDIVVAANNSTSSVSIDSASIMRNGQEGVNVILSTDANQTTAAFRDNLASAALAANGAVGQTITPFLTFNLTNSEVSNNGQVAGNIGGSGLVMRVGTTRGGDTFTVAGGFASAGNGGVNANVDGNFFTGNFGADFVAESFTSTVNPNTTGGTWTDQNENPRNGANDTFGPTGYQSDPLARLDLVFTNNTGDEWNATRTGASYNNDEPIFKSRTQAQDNGTDGGADDNGPFLSGTRVRVAQRLAARDVGPGGSQLPPTLTIIGAGGNSDNFLFSGIGESTFRAQVSGNVFGAGNGFLFDNAPYTDAAVDANGVPLGTPAGGPFGIDSMPWGWTLVP